MLQIRCVIARVPSDYPDHVICTVGSGLKVPSRDSFR